MQGTVKMFNYERGFGFIRRDDGGRDVFVHATELRRANLPEPHVGDRLEFEISTDADDRGRAVDLRALLQA